MICRPEAISSQYIANLEDEVERLRATIKQLDAAVLIARGSPGVRNEIIEECARVAMEYETFAPEMARRIAAGIRALKSDTGR